jgi:hypothetical protein
MWMMVGITIHLEGEERKPIKFIISETDEILIFHSGLALAGALMQGTSIQCRANDMSLGERRRPEVSNGDVLTLMIGLLCLGKPDFEAMEEFRGDEFFRRSLGLASVPSEGTLRQRLDELGCRPDAILREESAAMVARHAPKITSCYGEWVALDGVVRPRNRGACHDECNLERSCAAWEIPCAKVAFGSAFPLHSAFSSAAVKHPAAIFIVIIFIEAVTT